MKQKSPFTEEDYKSGDGMITSIWGPPMWLFLHTTSFNYPVNPTEEQKKYYYKFFKNLKNILPCRYCRENYDENIKKHKINYDVMKNRDTLSRWVYELHELVNKNLGKESGLSYEEVRDRFEHFRARCLADPTKTETNVKVKVKDKDKEKEKGCTEPLYGKKSKCVINIIPKDNRTKTFNIDPKCVITKGNKKK
jgi:hypothetical protein